MNLQTNLNNISAIALQKQVENDEFVNTLQTIDSNTLDEVVFKLNEKITPQINCTQCGNCCKTLMINVEEDEADKAAKHLQLTRKKFDAAYIEKSLGGKMLISKMPCHFLNDNKCTIYESRFDGCKEFPALHLPNFKQRLFTVFMHYNRCPIIFNVVEKLKESVAINTQ